MKQNTAASINVHLNALVTHIKFLFKPLAIVSDYHIMTISMTPDFRATSPPPPPYHRTSPTTAYSNITRPKSSPLHLYEIISP